jgi:hypothetical protein
MRRVFRIPFSRSRLVRDVDDEIAFHVQSRIDALVASGMPTAEARAAALRTVRRSPHRSRRDARHGPQHDSAQRRVNLFAELRQDVAFGLRTLRRNALLTALVVGGLALGIGANAAIYALVDAVLVRKLPVPDPDRLVIVGDPRTSIRAATERPTPFSSRTPLWNEVRKNAQSFEHLGRGQRSRSHRRAHRRSARRDRASTRAARLRRLLRRARSSRRRRPNARRVDRRSRPRRRKQ